jgi:hypothetical protein
MGEIESFIGGLRSMVVRQHDSGLGEQAENFA